MNTGIDPTTHLEFVEHELLGTLADLQLGRKAWDEFRRKHLLNDSSDDAEPSYKMPVNAGDNHNVEFLEGGPFPDTPVEIDDLTPEDVAYISGEVA